MIQKISNYDIDTKFKLMKFVYDNTDSFILNTFGYLWQERDWWNKFPIDVYTLSDTILGLHAYTIHTKGSGVLKTYYIVIDKRCRGQGIGKILTQHALTTGKEKFQATTFFVNSEEGSDGVNFYKSLFKNNYKTEKNQFGTLDYIFTDEIDNILKK